MPDVSFTQPGGSFTQGRQSSLRALQARQLALGDKRSGPRPSLVPRSVLRVF
jgi:hypothetical protein